MIHLFWFADSRQLYQGKSYKQTNPHQIRKLTENTNVFMHLATLL